MTPSLTRIAAILYLLAPCVCSATAAADELADRLAALTPDYPAPLLDVMDADGNPGFAATLLGVSLAQHGKGLSGEVPAIDDNAPLTVKTFWRANVRMDSRINVQFSFWDRLSVIRETIDVRAGPSPNDSPWEVGGVYVAEHAVDLEPIARAFSGRAWMGVNVRRSERKSSPMRARQLLEITLTPHARDSNVLEQDVVATFGNAARFIDARTRLGYGAEATLHVPAEWQTGNSRLGVVSSMAYRAPDQGAVVCRIVIAHAGGQSELALRSGVSTAICNIDMMNATTANHKKVDVFSSRDSGQFAADGTLGELHTFYAVFDLPADVERIKAITLVCDAETLLDVFGLALLP